MKKKAKMSKHGNDMPIGKLTRIKDFLPPPEELFFTDKKLKITIELDEKTVNFFKNYAEKHDAKYQRMMREVLKTYANKYSNL
jgi:predicted DNA binding CopG/RHH family protein